MTRGRPPPGGWRVYVLRCADATLYTGVTNDLAARVARHQAGKGARYTRARLPVELVYSERALDRGAALRREAQLKRLSRREKLELVAGGRAATRRRSACGRPRGDGARPLAARAARAGARG